MYYTLQFEAQYFSQRNFSLCRTVKIQMYKRNRGLFHIFLQCSALVTPVTTMCLDRHGSWRACFSDSSRMQSMNTQSAHPVCGNASGTAELKIKRQVLKGPLVWQGTDKWFGDMKKRLTQESGTQTWSLLTCCREQTASAHMHYLHRGMTLGSSQALILTHSETCLVGVCFSESAPGVDT